MSIDECRLVELPEFRSNGGTLSFAEDPSGNLAPGVQVPFEIKRVYYVYDLDSNIVRGGHAHRDTEEIAIAVAGSFDVHLRDGFGGEAKYRLSKPSQGLYMPRMIWREFLNFSPGVVYLVLASEYFDERLYYRDWESYSAALTG